MIRYERSRPSTSQRMYRSTGKDLPLESYGRNEDAYYLLAGRIDQAFPQGGTLSEIYEEVGRPLHLSQEEMSHLVKSAKREGYLE